MQTVVMYTKIVFQQLKEALSDKDKEIEALKKTVAKHERRVAKVSIKIFTPNSQVSIRSQTQVFFSRALDLSPTKLKILA